MSEKRKAAAAAALRADTVKAALVLLDEVGFEAFSMRELAKEMGESRQTLERAFGSREAFFLELARGGLERLVARCLQAKSLPELVEAYVGFAAEEPWAFWIMCRPNVSLKLGEQLRRLRDACSVHGVGAWPAAHGAAWLLVSGFASSAAGHDVEPSEVVELALEAFRATRAASPVPPLPARRRRQRAS